MVQLGERKSRRRKGTLGEPFQILYHRAEIRSLARERLEIVAQAVEELVIIPAV